MDPQSNKLVIRGYRRLEVIRLLASGMSAVEVAVRYNVPASAMTAWQDENLHEIDMVRKDIDSPFAGLWISKKEYRLAELQEDLQELNVRLARATDDVDFVRLIRAKHRALYQAADEMGQLPTKAQPVKEGNALHYVIEGLPEGSLT